jgi:hypothetical protein
MILCEVHSNQQQYIQTTSACTQLYTLCYIKGVKSLSGSLALYNQKQSLTVMPQHSRTYETNAHNTFFYSMIARTKYTFFTGR